MQAASTAALGASSATAGRQPAPQPSHSVPCSPCVSEPPSENPHRLPATVVPRRYDLTLEPDLDAATFAGADGRRGRRGRAHGRRSCSTPSSSRSTRRGSTTRRATRLDATVALDEETERATLTLDRPLPRRARPRVHLRFRGVLNDKLRGFYRSTFTDDDGAERVIATTQFEATDARRAFPCWDEPDAQGRLRASPSSCPTTCWPSPTPAEVGREPAGDGRRRGRASPTRWRCRPTWWPSSSARSRSPTRSTSTACRCGSSTRRARAHLTAFALEVGRLRPALLRRLLRHPLPGRQARPGRRPRLRLRGHGEPRLRHLPRGAAARRPRRRHPGRAAARSPTSSPTRSPTCGSATW